MGRMFLVAINTSSKAVNDNRRIGSILFDANSRIIRYPLPRYQVFGSTIFTRSYPTSLRLQFSRWRGLHAKDHSTHSCQGRVNRKGGKSVKSSRHQPMERIINLGFTGISTTRFSSILIVNSTQIRLTITSIRHRSFNHSPARRCINRTANKNASIRAFRTFQPNGTVTNGNFRHTRRFMDTSKSMIITLVRNRFTIPNFSRRQ